MREINNATVANRIFTGWLGAGLLVFLGLLPPAALLALNLVGGEAIRVDAFPWLLGMVSLLLIDLLLGLQVNGAWLGRNSAPAVVIWLIMGLAPALGALVTALALATVLRLLFGQHAHPDHTRWVTILLLTRSAIYGTPLLITALVYDLLGGQLPLLTLVDFNNWLLVVPALAFNLLLTFGVARLLLSGVTAHSLNLVRELQVLLLVLVLPVIYAQAGVLIFVLVLALMVSQFVGSVRGDRVRQSFIARVNELTMLNTIGQATAGYQELDDVLVVIHQQVSQLMKISVFYIALYDADRSMLDFRLVMAGPERLNWPPRPLGRGATEYVIHTRRVLNLSQDDRIQFEEMSTRTMTARYAAFLGVPLMHANQVLGVMAVLGDDRKTAFSAGEAQLLQTIGSHVGLAIHNATLFTHRSDLLNNLSMINESAQEILFNDSRRQALSAACGMALRISDADKAAIFLANGGPSKLTCIEAINLPVGWQMANLSPVFNRDKWPYVSANAGATEHARLGGYQAFAVLPMFAGSIFRGVLLVAHNSPHHYEQRTLNLLGILINHIMLMLDNTQLIEELEAHVSEMSQLLRLSRISTASIELAEFVPAIAQVLREMLDVDANIVCLADETQTWLRVVVHTDAGGTVETALSDFIHMSEIPEIMELTHQSTPIPVVYQQEDDQTSPGLRQVMHRYNQAFVALVPMHIEKRFGGVVILGKNSPFFFSPREWQFLEVAINQIAAQIRNASLYNEIQRELARRLQQLALVEEIAQQVSSSLDFNEIISSLLEAALRATSGPEAALVLFVEDNHYWMIRQRPNGDRLDSRDASGMDALPGIDAVIATQAPVLRILNAGVTVLMIPLRKKQAVIGVLAVYGPNEAVLRDNEMLLTRLAEHAVISIDNARFLEERQYEIDRLTQLRELGLRLASADDQKAVVKAILVTAQAVAQADDAAVIRCEAQQLIPLSRVASAPPAWRLPLALVQRTVALGQYQTQIEPASTKPGPQSVLAMPIKRGNQVHYVLYLGFAEPVELQDRDVQTLELLATQAAGHLENARLHEQLRAGRDQMRTILNSTRAGMILLDHDGRLLQYNPAAETLLHIDLDAAMGENFSHALMEVVHTNDDHHVSVEALEKMARMLSLNRDINTIREFEYSLEGRTTYIEEVGSPVRDHQDEIIGRLLVLRDITDQKLLEIQRNDLTHTMVHDLRGPLAAIINGLDVALVLVDIPENQEDGRKLVLAALTSARRLLRLVNSLLDIAQLEDPDASLQRAPVDFHSIVDTATATLLTLGEQASIRIYQAIPPDLPLVLIDRDKIERVIINLMDNALRFTPDGGEVLISAERSADGHWLEVCVADSGPGIPVDDRERIFERFQRVQGQNPLRGQKSSGLGLTSCKLAIEAHGGTIRVVDGQDLPGACFLFTLPIA